MGGLPRRATFFQQLQDEGEVVYFDLGNNFPKPSEQGNLKVSLIHQSLKEINPSVILFDCPKPIVIDSKLMIKANFFMLRLMIDL